MSVINKWRKGWLLINCYKELNSACDVVVISGWCDKKVDVESLQRQLKEREDRENKLKQLALKAKKEATELRNKVWYSALTQ